VLFRSAGLALVPNHFRSAVEEVQRVHVRACCVKTARRRNKCRRRRKPDLDDNAQKPGRRTLEKEGRDGGRPRAFRNGLGKSVWPAVVRSCSRTASTSTSLRT